MLQGTARVEDCCFAFWSRGTGSKGGFGFVTFVLQNSKTHGSRLLGIRVISLADCPCERCCMRDMRKMILAICGTSAYAL